MRQILLVDDSFDMHEIIADFLGDDFKITAVSSLQEARQVLKSFDPELILLDVTLPDGSGFDFCAQLKSLPEKNTIPVIFLTGHCDPTDKVKGFSLGAQDYMVKPIEPLELRARVQARIKNSPASPRNEETLKIGGLCFDLVRQRAFISASEGSADLRLTPAEFRILHFLARNEGKFFSRDNLKKHVWDPDVHVSHDNIYTHVSALRRKLGQYSNLIECSPRVGYRFAASSVAA